MLSETTEPFDSKLGWNDPWMVLYQMSVICVNWISKMAATTGHNFSIGLYGKTNAYFSSETRNLVEHKLYMINY
jgi:hypothetical protein